MLWQFLAKLLSRWADVANVQAARSAAADARDATQRERMANARIALLEADVEFQVAWRDRELARLRSEADIFRARSVLNTEVPERE